MMNPKVIGKWLRQGRPQTRHCESEGCSKATREGKPFCSEHVERLPYVQQVLALIEERERDEARVKKRGTRAVDPHSMPAREILTSLWVNGNRTVARLARELNMDFQILATYVKGLQRRGLVKVTPTRRGAGIVRLTHPRPPLESKQPLEDEGRNHSAA